MKPVDNFNAFLKRKKPDQYGYTFKKVIEKAAEMGFSKDDVRKACREIRLWLIVNENSKKANKIHWGKFILNWMRPKLAKKSRRAQPSSFYGKSRIEE